MPGPIAPYKPARVVNIAVSAQDTSTTGVKSSYVVPAAKLALIRFATIQILTGTLQIVRIQVIVGGLTLSLTIPAAGASSSFAGGIWLNTGDTVQINVTTLGAGTADTLISVEEYDAQ